MGNIYFDLTREFNADDTIAVLTSGQAVVFYRTAIMSKDGDWILRETPEACRRVLDVLAGRSARYRFGAPLDSRWLSGGWSSHLEFSDEAGRRVRCDFMSRPPRVRKEDIEANFAGGSGGDKLRVLGVLSLIRMKQTQRAKDYPVIGELARLLPDAEEIDVTTDPDRILELAPRFGKGSSRPAVIAAVRGAGREEIVVALAREINRLQERDRDRLATYERASDRYHAAFRRSRVAALPLPEAHEELLRMAQDHLPMHPLGETGRGTR